MVHVVGLRPEDTQLERELIDRFPGMLEDVRQRKVPTLHSARISFRHSVAFSESRRLQTIAVARAHVTLLQSLRSQFYRNTAPAAVGILLRIVAKRIQMR